MNPGTTMDTAGATPNIIVHGGGPPATPHTVHCTYAVPEHTLDQLMSLAPTLHSLVLDSDYPVQPYCHALLPPPEACRDWRGQALQHTNPVSILQGCFIHGPSLKQLLSTATNLCHLHLHCPPIDDYLLLGPLQLLTGLTHLSIRKTDVGRRQPGGVKRVRLPLLLSASSYENAWLPAFPSPMPTTQTLTNAFTALTNLKHLHLVQFSCHDHISSEVWEVALSNLTQLTYLSLPSCQPQRFQYWLTRLSQLQELVVVNTTERVRGVYKSLSLLTSLTALTVRGVQAESDMRLEIPPLPSNMPTSLHRLDVHASWMPTRMLPARFPLLTHCYAMLECLDEDFAHMISLLTSLQHLNVAVYDCQLLAMALRGLSALTYLHVHEISHTSSVSVPQEEHSNALDLARVVSQYLTKLRQVRLTRCSVELCEPLLVPGLTSLRIDYNRSWDGESRCTRLSEMTSLQALMLQGCNVVGRVLEHVAGLPRLDTLCLFDRCRWDETYGSVNRLAYRDSRMHEMVHLTRLEGFNLDWRERAEDVKKERIKEQSNVKRRRGANLDWRTDFNTKNKEESIAELKRLIRLGWGNEWGPEWQSNILAQLEAGHLPGSFLDSPSEPTDMDWQTGVSQELVVAQLPGSCSSVPLDSGSNIIPPDPGQLPGSCTVIPPDPRQLPGSCTVTPPDSGSNIQSQHSAGAAHFSHSPQHQSSCREELDGGVSSMGRHTPAPSAADCPWQQLKHSLQNMSSVPASSGPPNSEPGINYQDPFLRLLHGATGLRHLHMTNFRPRGDNLYHPGEVSSADMDELLLAALPHWKDLRTLHLPVGPTSAVIPHLSHLSSLTACEVHFTTKPRDIPEDLLTTLQKLPQCPTVAVNGWVVD